MDVSSARLGRPLRPIAAGVLTGLLCLSLTGCFGNPVEGIIDQAVGGALGGADGSSEATEGLIESLTGGAGDIELGSVPADFPSEIPLPDYPVLTALALTEDGDKMWNVNYQIPNAIDFLQEFKAEYVAAGFVEVQVIEVDQMLSVVYEGHGYTVHLNAMGNDADGALGVLTGKTPD